MGSAHSAASATRAANPLRDILHFADGRLVEKQTYAKAKVPLLKPAD